MSFLRRLDPHHKLYAAFALLLCLSLGLALWMLGRLEQISMLAGQLPAAPGQKLGNLGLQAHAGYEGARLLVWIAIGVTLGATALLVPWLRAEVARPAQQALAMARRLAGGDLSSGIGQAQAGHGGALLATMQEMNDSLASMIAQVRAGTESITGGAGHLATGAALLAAHTEEQAGALGQAGTAMAQLGATARQHTEQAQAAAGVVRAATQTALEGGAAIGAVATHLGLLDATANRIAGITANLDAIALQASSVGLHADVEAARAGANGRGFGVVAAEVRALALRSAESTRDLKLLIDTALATADAGRHEADKAARAMAQMAADIGRAAAIGGELAAASVVQVHGIDLAGQALATMQQACRRNAALVAQSGAGAVALREQAANLSRATAAFVLKPEHGAQRPALRLASSNAGPLAKSRPAGDMRLRHAPARPIIALAPAPKATRGHSAFARRSMDWEEF